MQSLQRRKIGRHCFAEAKRRCCYREAKLTETFLGGEPQNPRQTEAGRALWTPLAHSCSSRNTKSREPRPMARCFLSAVLPGAQRDLLCSCLCPWPLILVLGITEKKQRHERRLPTLPKHKPEESVPGQCSVIPHWVRGKQFLIDVLIALSNS